jgi:hypothetical protein
MFAKYEIQFHDGTGKSPMRGESFDDFISLMTFIKDHKTDAWLNGVNVHLPAHATEDERKKIRDLGFSLNW